MPVAAPTISYPPELPVTAHREELLEAIGANQVVVVAGETGSGKTTQLPKICLELGRTAIAHTQPRRLAARTVAERIADELGVTLGEAVGYAVRFSDRSRRDTQVRLMTDGLLLAEVQRDRLLRRYDTIIVDEAHERSLNIDFLLGFVKRILPRRPDLKLIVTSATIDPERFSRHFGGAPVVEVSGRTYPVEVRYRPPDEDVDQTDAIGDAVEELLRERPGDVLVFLSGEREIRDTADALDDRLPGDVEVLPLYARLSSAAQRRVFRPHHRRRVVLATNVAETSLTVPGIRYVVDPGTARISRYSARLKVQRLPIEPISQASADQRKGRCGRTSDGVCVRLYSDEDFEQRPRFTDPEILRTSLASVILQMAAIGLGEVEEFPFLDPPDRRQVRAGITLLQELGALVDPSTSSTGSDDARSRLEPPGARQRATSTRPGHRAAPGTTGRSPVDPPTSRTDPPDGRRLTPLGRRLAQLPVDPRMGRMVLEADRLGCADEVIVIAAALSIQDPRERPADAQEAADAQHARFADPDSDFIAYLNLWRYLRERQQELSVNQFRRRCRAEFLHYLRVREWQDLVGQLRQAAKGAGVTINRTPAEPREIHVALLSGLLSHVGLKDPRRREYQGARGARFAIFPGSGLARRQPDWVMVAELMETSRLWGLDAARIEPEWVEPLAGHLVKRTYSEPRWDRRRAQVVATERVTLYGLPIVADRTVGYGKIDPAASRELFIRRALVEGDWDTRHEFFHENRRRLEEAEELEERARRRGIVVDDQVLFDFFEARVSGDVVSGAHFDRWWRDVPDRELLTFPRELLVPADAADAAGQPDTWRQGQLELRLSYRFEPGSEHDGVTVHVPLRALPRLRDEGFEWLVPSLRLELVTALIRALPKELRRQLVPVPETATAVVDQLDPDRGALLPQLSSELERLRGVRVPVDAWDLARLPPHLRMTFRVEDDRGEPVAEGKDLAAVREQARPRLRALLSAATKRLEQTGLRAWTIGTLPRTVALRGTDGAVRAYPALVDEGETVGVRALDTPEAQRAAMRAGTRRLLLLTVRSPRPTLRDVALPYDDIVTGALDALVDEVGGPPWDEAGFARLRDHVTGQLDDRTATIGRIVLRIQEAVGDVEQRLAALPGAAFEPARLDVARQLGRLVYPGFVTATGADRLPDVERYLRAAARRLERLPDNLAVDRDRMNAIHELEAEYEQSGRNLPEVRWLLEELRVSQFAQALGTKGQVSAKRIRRMLRA